MIHLRQLGGVALEGPDGPLGGAPAQRHRLALMTVLARTAPAAMAREKLMTLLWPEHDGLSARRLLNLAIHVLRRALGHTAIRSMGDAVVLTPGAVLDEFAAFEAAANRGDLTAAVECYRGPFLDGFFLPRAAEFDRWAADLRARVADRHAGLLESLARAAEREGRWRDAVEWCRRLTVLDPGNGAMVRRLMLALEARNDRTGALAQARTHARYMREEFDAAPDPVVASLATALSNRAPAVPSRTERPCHDMAVLPLIEVSSSGEGHRMGDGLAMAIADRLSRVPGLSLASTASAFGYRGRGLTAVEIGAALQVSWILEGTVRRIGERVRVSVHLVDAREGLHRWSGAYDRTLGDTFTMEEELAEEITVAVRHELGGGGLAGLDLDERGLILRGRFALGRRTADALRTATRYFTHAVARAPLEAAGYAGLADAYALSGFYDYLRPADAFGSARRAARAALRRDRHFAPARATLAYTDLYFLWNLPLAEARFRRVLRQTPTSAPAHQWYGNLLVAAGRGEESVRMMARAASLDPQSMVASAALGWALYHRGHAERAVEQCLATIELDPGCAVAHLWQGLALQEREQWDEAIAALRRAHTLLDNSTLVTAHLARALAAAGARAEGTAVLEPLMREPGYLPTYEIAKALLALGRLEEALAWLERAHRERSHSMVFLSVDPQLTAVRNLPRVRALVPSPV